MSKKISDRDYLFLSAMLRAREPGMLTQDRIDRMLDAPGFDEAAKLLTECGYDDMSGLPSAEIESVLSSHRARILAELERMSPDPGLIRAFRLKYDYHNAKVLIKAQGAGIDGRYLLSDSAGVSPETLIGAFNDDDYDRLPEIMGLAIQQARGILSRTLNPQLADFCLDKAYFQELSSIDEELGSDFFHGYVEVLADSANLRAAVRTMRMGRDESFLKTALIPYGTVGEPSFAQVIAAGEGLDALFNATVFEGAARLGSRVTSSGMLTEFEKACDMVVAAYMAKASYKAFGPESVIAYINAVESEITTVRMILTGRLAGISPSTLRERLRDGNV